MTITDQQLKDIEAWAELLFTVEQVAHLLEVPADKFLLEYQTKGKVYASYQRGFLRTEAEVRKSEITLAKQGSSQAQEGVKAIIANVRSINPE